MKKLLILVALPLLFACQREEAKSAASAPTAATPVAVAVPVASSVESVATAKSAEAVKPIAVPPPATAVKLGVENKVALETRAPSQVAPPAVGVAPPVGVAVPSATIVASPSVAIVIPPAAATVAPSAVASDTDSMALAKKRNCFACHMIDKKIVGPAWKDVAAKYRGDTGAQARLEAKIGKGGSGAWGSMAMPPQPQVTAEERAILARFILNLK